MKVTRPPGRDPARNALRNTSINAPKANGSNEPQAANRTTAFHPSRVAHSVEEH